MAKHSPPTAPADDPRAPWLALASRLGWRPELDTLGGARPAVAFTGQRNGNFIRLIVRAHPPRAQVWVGPEGEEDVIEGGSLLCAVPRADLPGWTGGPATGDAAFDAVVALLVGDAAQVDRALVRLTPAVRALLGELVALGAHTFDDAVLLPEAATASAPTVEAAEDLLGSAVDLACALRADATRIPALLATVTDPQATEVVAAARRLLGTSGAQGGPSLETLLDHVGRLAPHEQVRWLLEVTPRNPPEWRRWVALAGPLEDAALDARIGTLLAGRTEVRSHLATLAAERLVRGLERGAPAATVDLLGAVVLDSPDALGQVLDRAAAASPAVLGWLGALRFGETRGPTVEVDHPLVQWRVAEALLAGGWPDADLRFAAVTCHPAVPIHRVAEVLHQLGAAARATLLARWAEALAEVAGGAANRVASALLAELARPTPPGWSMRMAARCGGALFAVLLRRLPERAGTPGAEAATRWLWAAVEARGELLDLALPVFAALAHPSAERGLLKALETAEGPARLQVVAALAACGTLGCVPALEKLDGFFADRAVRTAARAAIAAVQARGWLPDAGRLSVASGEAGGLSPAGEAGRLSAAGDP